MKQAQQPQQIVNNQFSVKMISLGDVEVGKSCLIKRYCEGEFVEEYVTTIGIDYGVKKINLNDSVVDINIFDMSGDDDFKYIRKQFYADAIGVIMVFDVNIKTTFDNLSKWEKEVEANGLDISKSVVIVLGNKVDKKKKREITTQQAKDWAKSKGYQYYETSAKNGTAVGDAFKFLFHGMYTKTIENRSRFIY